MSTNALAGLIGNYGDSGDESDDGAKTVAPSQVPRMVPSVLARSGVQPQPQELTAAYATGQVNPTPVTQETAGPTIHPAPIVHCPWSACYDEGSGFTYYWNQSTNAVTWEAPPEYLLALKIAQQQLITSGTTTVSAAEWQLYQQALVEQQNAAKIAKTVKQKAPEKPQSKEKAKNGRAPPRKRTYSDDEKIELITSYHNSDSESDNDTESPVKPVEAKPPPLPPTKPSKPPTKKAKTKTVEYGPTLPPNQNYTVPIGPEMPPETPTVVEDKVDSGTKVEKHTVLSKAKPLKLPSKKAQSKPEELGPTLPPNRDYDVPIGPQTPPERIPTVVEDKVESGTKVEEASHTPKMQTEDDEETTLLQQLKDKAKLLEKLGGELPTGLEKIIKESNSGTASPIKSVDDIKSSDIDSLLEEIEKTELPKSKKKVDMFDEDSQGSITSSRSIKSGVSTPVEPKPLFPSSQHIEETPTLFPSAAKIEETDKNTKPEIIQPPLPTEKKTNLYLADPSEPIERPRKKLRISNSVLPERKVSETPSYTTKYSQHIEGFSSERVGLGFSQDDADVEPKSNTISYGNGLTFTKGEVLNEKNDELDELADLVEAKLRHLNELQPALITPVQEMLIQMQTLSLAFRSGALSSSYWERWTRCAGASLAAHEQSAAPPGWTCRFQRSEGRYRYRRACDGLEQWEFPAPQDQDMEICTTPPPPPEEPAPLPPPPPPPACAPPSPPPARLHTPPPPAWHDPPPPGCELELTLPAHEPQEPKLKPKKQEIGDELLSFYNDLAEMEKQPTTEPNSPEPELAPIDLVPPEVVRPEVVRPEVVRPEVGTPEVVRPEFITHKPELVHYMEMPQIYKTEHPDTPRPEKEKSKKKSKVKISTSMGMKHKTVSSMVAKWQQVADEIHSD